MKYAFITGASRGIGRAIAIKLASEGLPVIINYRSDDKAAQDTLDTIKAQGGQGELLKADVSDPKTIEAALESWTQNHPDDYIDVLVNNAGIRHDNLMIFMEDSEWHSVLDTTLNALFHITRRVVRDMVTHRHGRVINITSLSGLKGLPGQTNYSAAKAAVIGATRALSQEVAQRGITVNAIAPGFIATDMTSDLDEKELKQQIPARRFGKPEEVAELAAFIASEKASYITGQVIQINGGMH